MQFRELKKMAPNNVVQETKQENLPEKGTPKKQNRF